MPFDSAQDRPPENRNYALAGAFVDELARCGLRHVCICPGSRSSPLSISFGRDERIKKWVLLDERSAAFFALGMAKYLNEPVAIVCSSGTATANFFPAIVEARYSLVPLLVLTADRPPELLEWGALQAIDQTRMYGSHVKWSVNMPTPEVSPSLMAFVRSVAGRGYATALQSPTGPVHFNFPFREPLEPVASPADLPASIADRDSAAFHGRLGELPFMKSTHSEAAPPVEDVRRLAQELATAKRGVIVCGPDMDGDAAGPVTALAARLGYPVLADCLSQVRCGPHDRSRVIDCYDAFIGAPKSAEVLAPEVVIRFGALPVSKPLWGYLERHRSARHILVDEGGAWRDPMHLTSEVWHVDPARLCVELSSILGGDAAPLEWLGRWRSLAKATRRAVAGQLAGFSEMFEGKVFAEMSHLLPNGSLLFAGNSMPVRDMDTFFLPSAHSLRFMANRGASGIDGVVSTALGVSAVASERVVLAIGDISFYHDMNGLLAAKAFGLKATIIVINNNGGGIFSFLPQAAYHDVFEPYFGTPHGLTFKSAADLYGLDYRLAADWLAFTEALARSLAGEGTTIIEVPSDRDLNVKLHRQVNEAVAAAVGALQGQP